MPEARSRDADLQRVIDAVGALADGPGSPLIVVSPRGVRGNPYDPTFVRPQA
ncbi:MAG: hypothetical protein KY451_01100 [Actinobacteria bacterium]|nr:hypothetical protein [Actinomycetota bacterium]MBW3648501.1 hypothetical protein [Actinomycetota bacterium]